LAAHEAFAGAALPTDAEEVWRYSRIGELDLGRYEPPPAEPPAGADQPPAATSGVLDVVGERAGLVLTAAGHVTAVESSPQLTSASAFAGGIVGAGGGAPPAVADILGSIAWSTDALSDLATAFLADAAVVVVPRGARLDKPIVIVHALPDGPLAGAAFPRTLVVVGEGAAASVVEVIVSGTSASLLVPVAELVLEDGASLTFHSVHQAGPSAVSLARQASRLGRDANLFSLTAALGGDYARCRTDSVLAGQGGSSRLLAAYLADGSQMQDFRTLQEHVAPRTTSDLLFKGAVAGHARSVYTGMIRMRHGARGANAVQTNRNLVLSEGAHADSVPNLDIEENDVRCSHASAVGPIDEDQRYYLESRGVPRQVAERLILTGFFAELFERSPVAPLAAYLPGLFGSRLEALQLEGAPA
jgi:Fe-S cluster assembly protein SufD